MNEPLIERGFAVVGTGAWLFGRAQPAAVQGVFTRRSLRGFICPDRGFLTRGELAEDGKPHAEFAGKEPHVEFAGNESHAESAEKESHAEYAESAEKEVHAESAENAEGLRDHNHVSQRGARAWCSSSEYPFLTRIDCGIPVSAVSDKVLVAPAEARTGAHLLRVVPMSFARSLRVTEFAPPSDRPTIESSDHPTSSWVIVATHSRTTRISIADGESLGVRPEAAVAWTGARPTGFCPRLRLLDILLPRGPRDLLLHFHGPAIVWLEGSEPRPLHPTGPRKAVF